MIVTERTQKAASRTIQLNDIPSDTAFRGTAHFTDGSLTGIFIKVSHNNNEAIKTQGEFVVVGLTMLTNGGNSFPFTARCHRVDNYEPINELEIVVKG